MIEKDFPMSSPAGKIVEKVIQDENLHYLHMIFPTNEGLPEHYSNATNYVTVLKGMLSIGLDAQGMHAYPQRNVLRIPIHTKMNVKNLYRDILEFIVVNAPAPLQ